jgi:hypothetical protein
MGSEADGDTDAELIDIAGVRHDRTPLAPST